MLRVKLKDISPGMTLALPVLHPSNREQMLLRAGYQFDEKMINRVGGMKIEHVWIEYPGLEAILDTVNPGAIEAQHRVIKHIDQTLRTIATGADEIDFAPFRTAMNGLMDVLLHDQRAAIYTQELSGGDDPFLDHACNVCFLSLLMGLRLGGYLINQRKRLPARHAKNVTTLGLGAMLHDIGMLELDSEVAQRWRETQDDSDEEWRKHVELGHKRVTGKIEPTAAVIILHHHQRYDGKGFPATDKGPYCTTPPSGDDIHIFARIVAAADTFDRLRFPPCGGGEAIPAVRVHRQMLDGHYKNAFDTYTLRALLSVAPPYTPGSIVTLSDGRTAAVRATNRANPCRPTVQIIPADPKPDDTPGPIVEITEQKDIQIAQIDGVDVLEDNFFYDDEEVIDVSDFQQKSLYGAIFNDAA